MIKYDISLAESQMARQSPALQKQNTPATENNSSSKMFKFKHPEAMSTADHSNRRAMTSWEFLWPSRATCWPLGEPQHFSGDDYGRLQLISIKYDGIHTILQVKSNIPLYLPFSTWLGGGNSVLVTTLSHRIFYFNLFGRNKTSIPQRLIDHSGTYMSIRLWNPCQMNVERNPKIKKTNSLSRTLHLGYGCPLNPEYARWRMTETWLPGRWGKEEQIHPSFLLCQLAGLLKSIVTPRPHKCASWLRHSLWWQADVKLLQSLSILNTLLCNKSYRKTHGLASLKHGKCAPFPCQQRNHHCRFTDGSFLLGTVSTAAGHLFTRNTAMASSLLSDDIFHIQTGFAFH